MEWLLIMFTIYGKHVGEPRWPTKVILHVGLAKKRYKMPPNKSFQVSEGSCFTQTMTNLRVFPRVKVLLTVLQLPTTIAKRRKGNSFRSG